MASWLADNGARSEETAQGAISEWALRRESLRANLGRSLSATAAPPPLVRLGRLYLAGGRLGGIHAGLLHLIQGFGTTVANFCEHRI
jgi:hypothetical protein